MVGASNYTQLHCLENIFYKSQPHMESGSDCSPDLTLPDYYLWTTLTEKLDENNIHTVEELKAEIITHIQQISPATVQEGP
uniref:Uncharacterized protein n=2 Tax=Arion vulgaris TaxID=1028688 RepID=A0A0B7BB73_9EUPU